MDLPNFRYHRNPLATGAIEQSDSVCECCEEARGYIYKASIYSEKAIDVLCPWCIADGSAAEKFNASFVDDYPLIEAGLDEKIIEEVCRRTPGYISWQQEVWQHHCMDACEFCGDAEKQDILALKGEALQEFLFNQAIDKSTWKIIRENYSEGGSVAIYKFQCLKCKKLIYAVDFS